MLKLKATGALALSFLTITLCGCPDQAVLERLNLKLDPGLSRTEKKYVVDDIKALFRYDLQAKRGTYFNKAFGGTSSADVARYLDERVNYVLPYGVDLEKRLRETVNRSYAGVEEKKYYTIASNVGVVLWFAQEAFRPRKLSVQIGEVEVPLESSRVGIIQLGEGFSKRTGWIRRKRMLSDISAVGTWVHEARHSDCVGGMDREDVLRFANGAIPVKKSCGNLHANCPAGHSLEGIPACDEHTWGAYAVGGLYEVAVSKSCPSCTDMEKKLAWASALDSLSRVLILDDLVNGKYGDPDMRSSGVNQERIHRDFFNFRIGRLANPEIFPETFDVRIDLE